MVQEEYLKLSADRNSKTKLSTIAKRASDLNEMRYSLMQRLEKMDRTSVDFFPVGSHIEYVHPMYSQKQKFGIVVAKDDTHCQCQFQGDEFQVKVDPIHLKLRFIRGSHPF